MVKMIKRSWCKSEEEFRKKGGEVLIQSQESVGETESLSRGANAGQHWRLKQNPSRSLSLAIKM